MEEQKKEQKTMTKKGKINRSGRSSKPQIKTEEVEKTEKKEKISFDVYFRLLLNKDNSVQPHHKIPMKSFFNKHIDTEETIEKFDEILKKY